MRIRYLEIVFMGTKLLRSSKLAMKDLPEAIMVPISQRRRQGKTSQIDEMPQNTVDYLSKWVEARALPTNDARVVVKFLKSIFSRFEHRAYWALKHINFDLKTAGDHQKLQLNELSKLRDQVYENSVIYKERTKKLHDSKIKNRIFNVGDQVLIFNSRLKIFSGKLKTH
nr:reverse transcriptase domain-containing protein [Tanacetum cinerariifolium]